MSQVYLAKGPFINSVVRGEVVGEMCFPLYCTINFLICTSYTYIVITYVASLGIFSCILGLNFLAYIMNDPYKLPYFFSFFVAEQKQSSVYQQLAVHQMA